MPSTSHRPEVVLVTGGAGFIGANFLLWMVPRYPDVEFINLDSLTYAGNLMNLAEIEGAPNYRFIKGDITDTEMVRDLFDDEPITTVVHFAAESHVDRSILDPLAFVRTNVIGTGALLEAARESWLDDGPEADRYRFYHISTDEVFGSLGAEGYFDEETPYDPSSPYSASKAGSDHLVRAYGRTYGLPYVISNCTNNYGPYQFPEKLIPLVIRNAVDREPIPVYGTGENVRDWLYVTDHCRAIEQVLLHGTGSRTYAVSGDNERTNLEIVHTVTDLVDDALGRPAESSRDLIQFVKDRPGHDFRYAMDSSRIQKELGWSPEHSLEKGLEKTVAWYLDHEDWVQAVLDDSYREYYEKQYAT